MLIIQLSFITGQHPAEIATATVDGVTYSARSRSSCIAKLARGLVAMGVPDQPWQAISPDGTVALRGRSLHGLAKTTMIEILRKYGIAGLMAGGAAAVQQQQ